MKNLGTGERNKKEVSEIRSIVREAMRRRRTAVVFSLARQFFSYLKESDIGQERQAEASQGRWLPIESLSQLRSVVGGRFRNLREKWVKAGLPLREHRGDRSGRAEVDREGWTELVVWINRQGYEVRLAEDGSSFLFEVRKVV